MVKNNTKPHSYSLKDSWNKKVKFVKTHPHTVLPAMVGVFGNILFFSIIYPTIPVEPLFTKVLSTISGISIPIFIQTITSSLLTKRQRAKNASMITKYISSKKRSLQQIIEEIKQYEPDAVGRRSINYYVYDEKLDATLDIWRDVRDRMDIMGATAHATGYKKDVPDAMVEYCLDGGLVFDEFSYIDTYMETKILKPLKYVLVAHFTVK